MSVENFLEDAWRASPGDVLVRGGKRWRVQWTLQQGGRLLVGIEMISASEDNTTNTKPTADDVAAKEA